METQTKSNKSRNIWIAVGVVAVLCLVACVVAYFVVQQVGKQVGQAVKMDPAQVQAVSDKIAQYDMPPGYSAQMSMSIMMYDLVMIAPTQTGSNSMVIMLMQFSGGTGLSQEQMQQQVRQSFEQQSGQRGVQMAVIETRQETIRGEQVTVTISEGETSGVKMRQLMTVFTGNGGPTVLMIQGATSDWDENLIQNFLESIR
jgi:flagellar basal body-associated protein FliL